MTPYLIIYNCKTSVRKFKIADAVIRGCAWDDCWFYHLNNTWFIKSEMKADEIGTKLLDAVDSQNDFIIIEIVNNYACWLPQQALDYLKDNIFNVNEDEDET
jgi:hypothetical protein